MNEQMERKVAYVEWSRKVQSRRLRWAGQLLRLPDSTSAKQALQLAEQLVQYRKGRRINTWIGVVKSELNELGKRWEANQLIS